MGIFAESLVESGDEDAVGAESVVEVVAELLFSAEAVEVDVGCGYDAALEAEFFVASDG